MATSSIFRSVVIDTEEKAEKLICALEKAERMELMAKPVKQAFVVPPEKIEEFMRLPADKEALAKHRERAQEFAACLSVSET